MARLRAIGTSSDHLYGHWLGGRPSHDVMWLPVHARCRNGICSPVVADVLRTFCVLREVPMVGSLSSLRVPPLFLALS